MYLGTAAGPELQVLAQESNEGTGTILHDCTKFSRILISPISSELRPQNLSLTAIISSLMQQRSFRMLILEPPPCVLRRIPRLVMGVLVYL